MRGGGKSKGNVTSSAVGGVTRKLYESGNTSILRRRKSSNASSIRANSNHRVRVLRAASVVSEEEDEGERNSSNEENSSDDEAAIDIKVLLSQGDLPQEFWQIQKLVRYLRIGNSTATILSLCLLHDFDLSLEFLQLAIVDAGGLEVLANLLETEDFSCKFGSLRILRRISEHPLIRRKATLIGCIESLLKLMAEETSDKLEESNTRNSVQLTLLAAETLANLAKFRLARSVVRRNDGVAKIIDLLDVAHSNCDSTGSSKNDNSDENALNLELRVARGCAHALWSLAKSKRNRYHIISAGGLPLLAKLVAIRNSSILIPVIGTLQECTMERELFCLSMEMDGLIADLVRHLGNNNERLRVLCASAIFRLAEDESNRRLVRRHGGLDMLVELLEETSNHINKELMSALTGAVWKCASSPSNVARFQELGLIPVLLRILHDQCETLDDLQFNPSKMAVLTNVVGALAECALTQETVIALSEDEGLKLIVKLISTTEPELLVNVSKTIGRCAENKETLCAIRQLDGVRLVWSLLRNADERVQASAAWALSPCIRNASHSGDMVRSLVGGLELICSLLDSHNEDVLAAICYAIANIAQDKENLAVITDHGVVEKLSRFANTSNDLLRAKLAEAIAHCCHWAGNRASFGRSGAVAPLVLYLESSHVDVHRATSMALYQLSKDPWNCVTMHQQGVVPHLLRLIGSIDEEVQEASADCLQNIRKLALACEKFRQQQEQQKEKAK